MNRAPLLTDALLREALAPGQEVVLPPGLLGSIGDAVRATPQVRPPVHVPLFDHLSTGARAALPSWLPANRALVLLAATVALLLALLGGALLGVGRGGPDRMPLTPTGLSTITSEWAPVDRVIFSRDGRPWAVAPGLLTRFDPATGGRQTWSAADDAAFSQALVAPAADGGIWVLADGRARRFDGEGFIDEIPVGATSPMELVPASDGSLWLASWDLGLQRWDGRRWVPEPAGRPTGLVDVPLLVLGPEDVWVENPGPGQQGEEGPYSLGVSHLTGNAWVTYGATDAPQLAGPIGAIEQAADGSIWITQDPGVAGARGIARFDGSTWTTIDNPPTPAWWLEADTDGSMWAITSASNGSATVAHWANGTWREFGPEDGVQSRVLGAVSVTPAGVFLGTGAGLLRYEEGQDRWEAVWPDSMAGRGPQSISSMQGEIVATSADEAWAADGTDLWHWTDGAWERPLLTLGVDHAPVTGIALAGDGVLWAATDRGVLHLRDGRLVTATGLGARKVAVGPDGTAWAIDGTSPSVRRLTPAGAGFEVDRIDCPLTPFVIAAAIDGTVYLGDIGYSTVTPGLARIEGGTCEMVDLPTAGGPPAITAVEPDPRGGVVVEALAMLPEHPGGDPWHGYLLHLDGTRVTKLVDDGEVGGGGRLRLVDAAGRALCTPAGSARGLEALEPTGWAPLLEGVDIPGPVSMAPDGTVFLVGTGGVYRWLVEETTVQRP